MRRSISKAIVILMVFSVMFSGMPYLAGSLDVHAATTKKKITLKATVTGQTEVRLKWNKIKKSGNGYAVFRDGKAIKHLSKKKTSFTDKCLEPGSTHKYQIKTYTKKKVTKWYNKKTGKWQTKEPAKKYRGKSKKVTKYTYKEKSNVVTVRFTKTAKPTNPTSQYNYNIRFVNQPYGNGGKTAIFLETNNPNPLNLIMNATNKNGESVTGNVIGISSDYDDVEFTDDDEFYVGNGIPTILSPTEAGQITFNVYEINRTAGTQTKVAEKTVTVKDYKAEEIAWRQSVIRNVCNDSMSKKEKMQAICGYILTNFKYYPNCNETSYFRYFKTESMPYWIVKEIDSALSPEVLVKFGNDLGYSLENLYPKYTPGTREWINFHMYAYSAEDDYYFQACPLLTTNRVSPSNIPMFNPSTFQFWGE